MSDTRTWQPRSIAVRMIRIEPARMVRRPSMLGERAPAESCRQLPALLSFARRGGPAQVTLAAGIPVYLDFDEIISGTATVVVVFWPRV
jgi:hypothetical protein